MRDAVVRVGGVCCDTMTEFSQYCPEILANDYRSISGASILITLPSFGC